jgi:O-antigen ligase
LLVGRFAGAEDGFSPNQLAGSLLYVIPFALALGAGALRRRRWLLAAGLGSAVAIMGLVFLLAQSRSGFIGLAASLLVLVMAPWKWGRWILSGTVAVALAAIFILPVGNLLLQADDATRTVAMEGGVNMAGRFEIWAKAIYGIQDFPFTGVGLGVFRRIAPLLYPSSLLPPSFDVAHAHNFFLQSALDFGLPGLVALLAIYLVAFVQCAWLFRNAAAFPQAVYWSIGLLAALVGQAVYSLSDAVAMGSKTNLIFWWLLALIFGVTAVQKMDVQAHQAAFKSTPAAQSGAGRVESAYPPPA